MATYVDASFLVALVDKGDQWHSRAVEGAKSRRLPWRTHALALGELIAIVGSHGGGKKARDAYAWVRDSMEVLAPSLGDLDAALPFVVRQDGALSLSDALFVHYMGDAAHGPSSVILSFDSDFDKAGVKRLPQTA